MLSRWGGGGEAGHRRGIWTELRVFVQMPHPRALWIVEIATKSQQNVARKVIKTVKKPHYGTMITVKSPAFARPPPPPSGLTLIGALNDTHKVKVVL